MAVVLGALALGATTAQAGPLGLLKVTTPTWYVQAAAHGPINFNAVHGPFAQAGPNWSSPIVFRETNGIAADILTLSSNTRHIVGPHPGDIPIGFPFAFGVRMDTSKLPMGWSGVGGFAFRPHPMVGHFDTFGYRTSLFKVPFINTFAYTHVQVGYHFASDPFGFDGSLSGSNEVPENTSQASGSMQFVLDRTTGQYVLAIVLQGLYQQDIMGAYIHRGLPGTNGPIVMTLGSGSQFEDLQGVGVVRILGDQILPAVLIPDLVAGNLYVNVDTLAYPTGEVRAQLSPSAVLPPALSGRLHFNDRIGLPESTIQYRLHGPDVIYEDEALVDPDGTVAFANPGTAPVMNLILHPQPYLQRVVHNIDMIQGTDELYIEFDTGDIDNDNEVTLADYSRLAVAFSSVPGDPNWDQYADLNADEEVNLADYAALARNFGMFGEEE